MLSFAEFIESNNITLWIHRLSVTLHLKRKKKIKFDY